MKTKEKFIVVVRVKPVCEEDRELYSAKQMEKTLKVSRFVM